MPKYEIPEDMSIPDWLKATGVPSVPKVLTDSHTGGKVEDWKLRAQEDKDRRAAEKAAKNAKGLLRLKLAHQGHCYDRKLRIWTCKACKQIVTLCTCEPSVVTHNA